MPARIDDLSLRLREAMKVNADIRGLSTVPGVGPVTAGAIMAFAPDFAYLGEWAQLRGLARPRALTTLDGRKGEARQHE